MTEMKVFVSVKAVKWIKMIREKICNNSEFQTNNHGRFTSLDQQEGRGSLIVSYVTTLCVMNSLIFSIFSRLL